jgi:hypothetical protein
MAASAAVVRLESAGRKGYNKERVNSAQYIDIKIFERYTLNIMYQSIVRHDDFKTYIFRRIITAIIISFLITIFIFCIFHDTISQAQASAQYDYMLQNKIHEINFGLDPPYVVQYFNWLSGIFRGDFGAYYQGYPTN